jgi:hypothetical protein
MREVEVNVNTGIHGYKIGSCMNEQWCHRMKILVIL